MNRITAAKRTANEVETAAVTSCQKQARHGSSSTRSAPAQLVPGRFGRSVRAISTVPESLGPSVTRSAIGFRWRYVATREAPKKPSRKTTPAVRARRQIIEGSITAVSRLLRNLPISRRRAEEVVPGSRLAELGHE